jgi:hypothetical protein
MQMFTALRKDSNSSDRPPAAAQAADGPPGCRRLGGSFHFGRRAMASAARLTVSSDLHTAKRTCDPSPSNHCRTPSWGRQHKDGVTVQRRPGGDSPDRRRLGLRLQRMRITGPGPGYYYYGHNGLVRPADDAVGRSCGPTRKLQARRAEPAAGTSHWHWPGARAGTSTRTLGSGCAVRHNICPARPWARALADRHTRADTTLYTILQWLTVYQQSSLQMRRPGDSARGRDCD